ncbi:formate dehydrogenase accessory protein FdhE [Rhodobacteraceae bacterium CH30]|nr:formate dehydrogenase accessory protein FdhE [Rhodobacteraceae bacterium CH30]
MSIRIVPEGELTQAAGDIPPLLLPDPKTLYLTRAQRLETLADGHDMADYLRFCARIARAQHALVAEHPLALPARDAYFAECARHGLPPLGSSAWPRDQVWQDLLDALLGKLLPGTTGVIADTIMALQTQAREERETLASALLAGRYDAVSSADALFVWAALSVYFSQLASQLKIHAITEPDESRHLCPVCSQGPVASVVKIGDKDGLRYLHCTLCESEWHMVRVKCSNCESTRDIGYWSPDDKAVAVRAESCGDCGSYLKVMALGKDMALEAVADDLATLMLDAAIEEEGFVRSGINPFLFPSH